MQEKLNRVLETISFKNGLFVSNISTGIKSHDVVELLLSVATKRPDILTFQDVLKINGSNDLIEMLNAFSDRLKSSKKSSDFFMSKNLDEALKKLVFIGKNEYSAFADIYFKSDENNTHRVNKLTSERVFLETAAYLVASIHSDLFHSEYSRYLSATEKPISITRWLARAVEAHIFSQGNKVLNVKNLAWSDNIPATDLPLRVLDATQLQKAIDEKASLEAWPQILNRMSSPILFMAWVWSLFSSDRCTRQILWIRGAGNDGKTTLSNAIIDFLGRNLVTSWDLDAKTKNQFTNAKFLGKVLAVNSETHIHQILEDRSVFRITGNDAVDIEQKNQESFTTQINAHMLFTANHAPRINTLDEAQLSRILYIEIDSQDEAQNHHFKSDIGFKDRLINEMYPFLAQCKHAYYFRNFFDTEVTKYWELKSLIESKKVENKLLKAFNTPLNTDRIRQIDSEIELMRSSCTMHSIAYVSEFYEKFLTQKEGSKIRLSSLRSLFFEESSEYHYATSADYNRLMFLLNKKGFKIGSDGRYIKGLAFKSSPETDTAPSVGD